MKKIKIQEQIYSKTFKGIGAKVYFKDLPKDIKDNDEIDILSEEGFYSENNSYDTYTKLIIIRERDETDEEYEIRISKENNYKKIKEKQRYETYLKLKKEFENE